MNIVPKVESNIDQLITKALHTSMSMVQTNTSIGGIIKQVKSHFCIKGHDPR